MTPSQSKMKTSVWRRGDKNTGNRQQRKATLERLRQSVGEKKESRYGLDGWLARSTRYTRKQSHTSHSHARNYFLPGTTAACLSLHRPAGWRGRCQQNTLAAHTPDPPTLTLSSICPTGSARRWELAIRIAPDTGGRVLVAWAAPRNPELVRKRTLFSTQAAASGWVDISDKSTWRCSPSPMKLKRLFSIFPCPDHMATPILGVWLKRFWLKPSTTTVLLTVPPPQHHPQETGALHLPVQ